MRIAPVLLVAALLWPTAPALSSDPDPTWLTSHTGDDGQRLLTTTGLPDERQAEILNWLQAWQRGHSAAASAFDTKAADGKWETTTQSAYYWRLYRSVLPPTDAFEPGTVLPEQAIFETQAESLGQQLTVTKRVGVRFPQRSKERVVIIKDSLGGERHQSRNRHGLLWAKDVNGPLAGVEWDVEGRPLKIHIGLELILEYIYPSDPTDIVEAFHWTEKRLSTIGGKVLGTWSHQAPPEPRAGARLWGSNPPGSLFGQPLIGEWDVELYPQGSAVIPLDNYPYALLPLGDHGEIWRSISLPLMVSNNDDRQAFTADRLDYTDRNFRLWLYLTGPAGTAHSVLVEHPRNVVAR